MLIDSYDNVSYVVDIVDFPIEKKDRILKNKKDSKNYPLYKSTFKITLTLTRLISEVNSKEDEFECLLPLSEIIPKQSSYSINTIKQMIESVVVERFDDKQVLWAFDKNNNLSIIINNNEKIPINSIVLHITYGLLMEETPDILVETSVNIANKEIYSKKSNKLRNQCMNISNDISRKIHFYNVRNFIFPYYSDNNTKNTTINFILPKGWRLKYAQAKYKNKPCGYLYLQASEYSKCKNNTVVYEDMIGISYDDLLKEDAKGNTTFVHYWNYDKNNKSVWSITINKKSIEKELHIPSNNCLKNNKILFTIHAGIKNKLIVFLACMLLLFSIIFTAMFWIILMRDVKPDYINYLFADVGLLTVIFAFFFSYAVQKYNGLRLYVSGDWIKWSIRLSIILALVCIVLLAVKMVCFSIAN